MERSQKPSEGAGVPRTRTTSTDRRREEALKTLDISDLSYLGLWYEFLEWATEDQNKLRAASSHWLPLPFWLLMNPGAETRPDRQRLKLMIWTKSNGWMPRRDWLSRLEAHREAFPMMMPIWWPSDRPKLRGM